MSNEKTIINQEANKLQRPFEKLAALNVCVCVCVCIYTEKTRAERGKEGAAAIFFLSLRPIPFHRLFSPLFFYFCTFYYVT